MLLNKVPYILFTIAHLLLCGSIGNVSCFEIDDQGVDRKGNALCGSSILRVVAQ